jgi:hypothetical protein
MAKTGHWLDRSLCALAVAIVASVAGCTIYPSAPAEPAYDTDVLPILGAHCLRCHGDNVLDGGLPYVPPGVAADAGNPNLSAVSSTRAFLGQYGSNACPPAKGQGFGPDDCRYGAAFFATQAKSGTASSENNILYHTIHQDSDSDGEPMPPPPASPLDEHELSVLDAWMAEKPPICSRKSNPDSALHCESSAGDAGFL